jgi:hypothetical protein
MAPINKQPQVVRGPGRLPFWDFFMPYVEIQSHLPPCKLANIIHRNLIYKPFLWHFYRSNHLYGWITDEEFRIYCWVPSSISAFGARTDFRGHIESKGRGSVIKGRFRGTEMGILIFMLFVATLFIFGAIKMEHRLISTTFLLFGLAVTYFMLHSSERESRREILRRIELIALERN